jgi:hypothetical protein
VTAHPAAEKHPAWVWVQQIESDAEISDKTARIACAMVENCTDGDAFMQGGVPPSTSLLGYSDRAVRVAFGELERGGHMAFDDGSHAAATRANRRGADAATTRGSAGASRGTITIALDARAHIVSGGVVLARSSRLQARVVGWCLYPSLQTLRRPPGAANRRRSTDRSSRLVHDQRLGIECRQ